jgi:hypothetical protein
VLGLTSLWRERERERTRRRLVWAERDWERIQRRNDSGRKSRGERGVGEKLHGRKLFSYVSSVSEERKTNGGERSVPDQDRF